MIFKFAYFVELTKGYQPAKFQCCRLSGSRFTKGLQKHNDDVISYFWYSKFPYFVKPVISYQPAKFQIPQLSESNFTEVGIRHPKNNYDVIMTSLHNMWFSKLHILWNLIEAISLLSLDQILRDVVENTPPPPDLHALKKPSPCRVKLIRKFLIV